MLFVEHNVYKIGFRYMFASCSKRTRNCTNSSDKFMNTLASFLSILQFRTLLARFGFHMSIKVLMNSVPNLKYVATIKNTWKNGIRES